MGCNAWNHDINCPCDFRGGHGFGGGGGGRRFSAAAAEPILPGWSRSRSGGTVASYGNTNARCPECGARVIFYRSPFDGRVFFDPPLGPPWPKHWCTDSRRWGTDNPRPAAANVVPLRTARISVALPKRREVSPDELGWEPLVSGKTYSNEGRVLLTGDVQGKFTELSLFGGDFFDRDGPIWTRPRQDAPGFFDIAVLWSDPWGTNPRELPAFDVKLLPLGIDVLSRVVKDDPAALAEAGRFMLYEAGNLAAAIVYLERAQAAGAADIPIDLAVAALFANGETE
jgi:hypothetical protein